MTTMTNDNSVSKALKALEALLESADESIRLQAAQTILKYDSEDYDDE